MAPKVGAVHATIYAANDRRVVNELPHTEGTVPRVDADGIDQSWQDVPYMVVPPFTARPLGHAAIAVTGYLPSRSWGDTSYVYIRTQCGKEILADRSNNSWSALCQGCFPRTPPIQSP